MLIQILILIIIGRKEMFYLTTYSTHFYLRLYGIGINNNNDDGNNNNNNKT